MIKIVLAGVAYSFAAGSGVILESTGEKCGGVERWEVKVLKDEGLRLKKEKEYTIAELLAMETPDVGRSTARQPLEHQKVLLRGVHIAEKIREDDDDLHLVLEDDQGRQLIAEIPYFKCPDAKKTPFAGSFLQSRINFLSHARDFKKHKWNVRGVLFVDLPHPTPQHGVAENNIEVHPVLSLELADNP